MEFSIKIIETLARLIEIEADTRDIALETVQNQYANEVWVLDSSDFKEVKFLILEADIIPEMDQQAYEEEAEEIFCANIRYDDISPEMLDYGEEYHTLESNLTSSYTQEQMEIYVTLEAMREGIIADMKKSFYIKGYKDAMNQIDKCESGETESNG